MKLAVAKNFKMAKKFDIDDVINTFKISDTTQDLLNDSKVSRGLHIVF